jgi:hypothetical protein
VNDQAILVLLLVLTLWAFRKGELLAVTLRQLALGRGRLLLGAVAALLIALLLVALAASLDACAAVIQPNEPVLVPAAVGSAAPTPASVRLVPTEGAAAGQTVDVYCHDTMYVIDLARLQGTLERYEAAKAIMRCVQEAKRVRDATRCPNAGESLRLLFRRSRSREGSRRSSRAPGTPPRRPSGSTRRRARDRALP